MKHDSFGPPYKHEPPYFIQTPLPVRNVFYLIPLGDKPLLKNKYARVFFLRMRMQLHGTPGAGQLWAFRISAKAYAVTGQPGECSFLITIIHIFYNFKV